MKTKSNKNKDFDKEFCKYKKNSLTCGVDAAMREATTLRLETDMQTNVRKCFGQGLIPGSLQGITYIIQFVIFNFALANLNKN